MSRSSGKAEGGDGAPRMKRKDFEAELKVLHGELVAMQEWMKASGAKVCVVFEGRDTAGSPSSLYLAGRIYIMLLYIALDRCTM